VIKPLESGQPGETVSTPGLPPILPPVVSSIPGAVPKPTEKIEIDLAPLRKPAEAGTPAGSTLPVRPGDAERADTLLKFKLKSAPIRGAPPPPALPGSPEGKSRESAAAIPQNARPPTASAAGQKIMPAFAPLASEITTPAKRSLLPLLGLVAALLVCFGEGYYWFFVRVASPASKPAVIANPSPAPPKAQLSAAAAGTRAGVPGENSAKVSPTQAGQAPANSTVAAPVVVPAKTPAGSAAVPGAPSAGIPLPAAPPQPAAPSAAFRAFVDHLKIGGIRTGPPARLFVDGVAYHPGDIMNRNLGVVFIGVDEITNEILFKDAKSAVIRRRF